MSVTFLWTDGRRTFLGSKVQPGTFPLGSTLTKQVICTNHNPAKVMQYRDGMWICTEFLCSNEYKETE